MSAYIVVVLVFGGLVLLTAWLPMVLKEAPLSLPIACVALGAAIFAAPGLPASVPHPIEHLAVVERLTEIVVVMSLMGAGLKIDRPPGWIRWRLTWRLLGVAMPLTIAALVFLGQWLLGLGLASALLLAAALAPTDPVLASDVQVGPPQSGEEDEARFALTSEAGLNDGLALPFLQAAVALAAAGAISGFNFGAFSLDVMWRLAVATALGVAIGWALGWVLFHLPNRSALSRTGDGFVAAGIALVAFATTEIAQGYGCLAVFVAAVALRSSERGHPFHERLHEFVEQLERLLVMALLVLLGGAVVDGGLLSELTPAGVAYGLVAVLLVRPMSGWIGLIGTGRPAGERAVIAFYGIRGVGTIYYVALGMGRADFESSGTIWSVAAFVVLLSIFLHGVTVTPVMRRFDRLRRAGRAKSPPASDRRA